MTKAGSPPSTFPAPPRHGSPTGPRWFLARRRPQDLPLRWPWDLWFLSSFRAPNEVICNPVEDASGDLLWWDDADRVAAYVADRLSERYTLTVPGYLNPEYVAEWELKEKP